MKLEVRAAEERDLPQIRDLIDKYETLRNAGFSIHFIIPEYKLTGIEEEFDSKEYTGWLV